MPLRRFPTVRASICYESYTQAGGSAPKTFALQATAGTLLHHSVPRLICQLAKLADHCLVPQKACDCTPSSSHAETIASNPQNPTRSHRLAPLHNHPPYASLSALGIGFVLFDMFMNEVRYSRPGLPAGYAIDTVLSFCLIQSRHQLSTIATPKDQVLFDQSVEELPERPAP